jgi:hypothetical protein
VKKYSQAGMQSQRKKKNGTNHNLINITTLSKAKKPKQKIKVAKMVSQKPKDVFKPKKSIKFDLDSKKTNGKGEGATQ